MPLPSKKISFALIAAILLITLVAYFFLPQQMAMHLNDAGTPDSMAPKWIVAWLLPLAMLILHFTRTDAGRGIPEANLRDWSWISLAVQIFLAFGQLSLLLYNYDHGLFSEKLLPFITGILLIAAGNYLFRIRPNVKFGIRNPWTLSDPQVWRSAHRFAGVTFIAAGLLLILVPLLQPGSGSVTFPTLIVLFALNYAASYLFYRRFARHGQTGPQ